jgi:O-antigen ligase
MVSVWELGLYVAAVLAMARAGKGVFEFIPGRSVNGPLSDFADFYVLLSAGIIALAAVVAARDFRKVPKALWSAWPISLTYAWMGFSVVWSIDPSVSFLEFAYVSVILVLVIGLTSRFGIRGVTEPVRIAGMVMLVVNVLLLSWQPSFAFHQDSYLGAFQSVFDNKNALALFSVCVIICALAERPSLSKLGARVTNWVLLAGSLFTVVASQSATALLATFVAILASIWLALHDRIEGRKAAKLVLLSSATLGIALVLWRYRESFLGLFARDTTLTGRVELWEYVWSSVLERPWIGYGYQAFWAPGPSVASRVGGYWIPYHAHSGYLEAMLDGGVVLLGLLVLQCLLLLIRSIAHVVSARSTTSWYIVVSALVFPIYNLSESILLRHGLVTALFASALLVSRTRRFFRSGRRQVTPSLAPT